MNTTVNDQPPEREPGYDERHFTARHAEMFGVADETVIAPPVVHFDPDRLGVLNAPCGFELDVQGPEEWSTNPARVTCPPCAATLVDGQLADIDVPEVRQAFEPDVAELERQLHHAGAERTNWRDMSDDELEDRLRGSLKAAAEFPELASPVGPAEPPAEHRTVSVEVLTPELLAEAWLTREDGTVGVVLRLDGALCDVDKTDEPWIERPAAVKLIDLLRHAEGVAASVIDPSQAAELLMPGADVLAALAGQPVGSYTAPVPSSYGVVQSGWFVGVETRLGDGSPGHEWLLVEDRRDCPDPRNCVVAGGDARTCAVVTVRGRGVQHIETWRPVYVRIPAATEVAR